MKYGNQCLILSFETNIMDIWREQHLWKRIEKGDGPPLFWGAFLIKINRNTLQQIIKTEMTQQH